MIGNITKGAGFSGTLKYDMEQEGAELLDTNCASDTPEGIAREMREIANQNPRCTRPVFHTSLSSPTGERLTDDKWREVASDYMKEMGYGDSQYAVTRHTKAKHDHIHIVCNRVKQTDFSVVKDSNDYKRQETTLRALEQKHGLKLLDKEAGKSAEDGYAASLRTRIDLAMRESKGNRAAFLASCERQGVKPILNQSATTGRISGASFTDASGDGKVIKGRDLGKQYSWPALEKRLQSESEDGGRGGSGKPQSRSAAPAPKSLKKAALNHLRAELEM